MLILLSDQNKVIFTPHFLMNHEMNWLHTKNIQQINRTVTSKASKLMKLAIAKPSIMSSSQDTDSRFLRRGGRCLTPGKAGRHSPAAAPPSKGLPLQSSWSEAEDGDEALCWAGSALLLRRSLSRWDRERRLCLHPPFRLGPSMSKCTAPIPKPN